MTYQIHAGIGQTDSVYTPRGGCEEFLYCKEPEFIAEGPAETGKTLAACWKIHMLASKYPGLNGAIVRKTQKSIYGSVLQTFDRVIKGAPVIPYGGEKPEKYIYKNGSVIWIGGMDNPDKVLSSERDFFYANQVEELILDDWEKLLTRTTGRGAIMPYTMLFGDCNPSGRLHWIRQRESLKKIKTRHQDNPTLYDENGVITEQGTRSMSALDSLTGVRYKRLRLGEWASAEGAVYDTFAHEAHVKERDPLEMKSWALACDEGYTNPAVILLVGVDSDGRWHIHREWYERGKLQSAVVAKAKEWKLEYNPSMCAVDASAAGLIADMRNAGIGARPAKGGVFEGIQTVQNMLKVAGDKKPRLTIDPSCINTINEFESYAWKQNKAGGEKDEPVKENDHCFVGSTPILTKKGWQRIDDIKAGDAVWSPLGWNKVYRAGSTGTKEVKDYGVFTCTPDNKILTTNGLKDVDALGYCDKIMVLTQPRSFTFKEFLTGVILTPSVEIRHFILDAVLIKARMARRDFYTETYGNTITAKSLTGIWYITLTAILGIITFLILSLSLILNMLKSTIGVFGMEWKTISEIFKKKQKNGMRVMMVKNGTVSTQKSNGKTEKNMNLSARFVARNILHPFLVEANTVIQTAKQRHCEGEEVWNLATKYGMYFANGILVSNSMDALRYLADIGIVDSTDLIGWA